MKGLLIHHFRKQWFSNGCVTMVILVLGEALLERPVSGGEPLSPEKCEAMRQSYVAAAVSPEIEPGLHARIDRESRSVFFVHRQSGPDELQKAQVARRELDQRLRLNEGIKSGDRAALSHQDAFWAEKGRLADLAEYDLDRDGKVTWEERVAVSRKRTSENLAERVKTRSNEFLKRFGKEIFGRFDKDGDGAFDADELADAERAVRRAEKALLARFDTNSDGVLDEAEKEKMNSELQTTKPGNFFEEKR